MSGSLIKVDEFTVTSALSDVIIGGGSSGSSTENFAIDNTYDVYVLQYFNVFMSSDGAQNKIRFTVGGTADASSNYDRVSVQMYTNQGFFNSSNANGDHISSLGLGTTHDESDNGTLYLFNFHNSSEYSFITREHIQTNNAGETAGIFGGAVLTVAQATDGVQFLASTGNIASGTFKLYGIKK
tara:strand:- start:1066 stop:1614 length:549 start_codon:yes stop_codon:yes gene_type:complete